VKEKAKSCRGEKGGCRKDDQGLRGGTEDRRKKGGGIGGNRGHRGRHKNSPEGDRGNKARGGNELLQAAQAHGQKNEVQERTREVNCKENREIKGGHTLKGKHASDQSKSTENPRGRTKGGEEKPRRRWAVVLKLGKKVPVYSRKICGMARRKYNQRGDQRAATN